MPREPVGANDRVDPILHTVRSGENFWTISKLYYDSGRYYKSLHSANRKLVPVIGELYVGTTIKVPPLEDLDPTLIEAPSRVSRTSRPSDEPRAPAGKRRTDVELGLPTVGASRVRDRTEDAEEPAQPTYKVRQYDTLRGIARDTLGDARRYREILELNRDVIDDPAHLIVGQKLNLPEDATVGRRMNSGAPGSIASYVARSGLTPRSAWHPPGTEARIMSRPKRLLVAALCGAMLVGPEVGRAAGSSTLQAGETRPRRPEHGLAGRPAIEPLDLPEGDQARRARRRELDELDREIRQRRRERV